MKKERFYLLLFVAGIVMMQSCGSAKIGHSKYFVVVEQTDSVYGSNEDNKHELEAFTIDVPFNGPTDGIEQVDLRPDGTDHHSLWKGAKTLDDLRKTPNN